MLLQDCPIVHAPIKVEEHHFNVFADFRGSSYARRYELLCQRLVQEGLYDASTLLLSSEADGSRECTLNCNLVAGYESGLHD